MSATPLVVMILLNSLAKIESEGFLSCFRFFSSLDNILNIIKTFNKFLKYIDCRDVHDEVCKE